ncbi:MAG: hypothetical protein V1820_03210, partial [archaeon]
ELVLDSVSRPYDHFIPGKGVNFSERARRQLEELSAPLRIRSSDLGGPKGKASGFTTTLKYAGSCLQDALLGSLENAAGSVSDWAVVRGLHAEYEKEGRFPDKFEQTYRAEIGRGADVVERVVKAYGALLGNVFVPNGEVNYSGGLQALFERKDAVEFAEFAETAKGLWETAIDYAASCEIRKEGFNQNDAPYLGAATKYAKSEIGPALAAVERKIRLQREVAVHKETIGLAPERDKGLEAVVRQVGAEAERNPLLPVLYAVRSSEEGYLVLPAEYLRRATVAASAALVPTAGFQFVSVGAVPAQKAN